MKIKQTLQNPFVLVAQGFVVGAALFFATAPRETGLAQQSYGSESAAIVEKIDA
ncbi:MAG TPA: hypothetical protein VGW34_15980 [Allosphingosinicella sp.]|nr:hypothetical protein [Allosphingosinicella sp.]